MVRSPTLPGFLAPALAAALSISAFGATGCTAEGCLAGDDAQCTVPTPCKDVAFSCEAEGFVEARVLKDGDPVPGGLNALGAVGDFVLGNDKAVAVIEALDNANFLGPSGGNLLDLGTRGGNDDNVNQILQVVGILPGDALRWTSLEVVSSGPEVAAIQVRGTLDGRPWVKVAQRYEVRRCEPGIRLRTEVVNLGRDADMWALSDGFYWSGREALPFAPGENAGFRHDAFDLLTIDGVYRTFPYLGFSGHSAPNSSYASVACNVPSLEGFNSDQVSAAGLPQTIVPSRDHLVFERFIAVAPKDDVAGAADVAQEVRRQLFGEAYVTLSGTLIRPGGAVVDGGEHRGAILVRELPADGAPPEKQIAWTQVVVGTDGTFSARVPANKTYVLDVHAFGRSVTQQKVTVGSSDVVLDALPVPLVGKLDVLVTDDAGQPMDARVVVVAADSATRNAVSGKLFGAFSECTPLLGSPHGASPACNQVLVRGQASFEVPSGRYHVYATAGPFHTLAMRTLSVQTAPQELRFQLERLPLQPVDTVSADLHVHGRSSFDSSIPDFDRVLSFAAANVDVIAATDHDVIGDYALQVKTLGLEKKVAVMVGLETTGHIPWFYIPESTTPRVIGHYNFWPLKIDYSKPRRGAPWDELIEPGTLFSRVAPLFDGSGVIELNHPWADTEFGRDLGYPRALKMNCLKPLPMKDDGTGTGMFFRTPEGSQFANHAYHAQEVMNGSRNSSHLQYRAVWFCFLNQGIVRAGTANSDSHSLTDNVLGTPRNLVFAKTSAADFDAETFNEAVRKGRLLGTNGPIIEAVLREGPRETRPSLEPLAAPGDGARLGIRVTAAPWIPVREVRIVVNGKVAKTLDALSQPQEAFGRDGLERLAIEVPLAELLPADGKDAWIVVEAGAPLPLAGDLDENGIPDTSDNNGDGKVDRGDVKEGSETGPLEPPPAPAELSDPNFHFGAVHHGGLPQAFTNPFIFDRDGGGYTGPGAEGGAN